MSTILDAFIAVLTHVQRFGPVRGLRLYWTLNSTLQHSSRSLVEVHVPGLRHSALLRPQSSDREVFSQIYIDQHYGFPLETSPKLILDCGANIGLSTLYFAARYPSATIYAIEPDPQAFEVLARNTSPYPNIRPIRAAVWGTHAPLCIVNSGAASWEHRVDNASNTSLPLVESVTISELLRDSGVESIGLLKLDIQGAEKSVFDESCHEWLHRTEVLMVELHDSEVSSCSRTVYQALVKYDFAQLHNAHTICVSLNDSILKP